MLDTLTPEEKQLLLLLGWFRRHYALYLGLSQERPATRESILQFGTAWFGSRLLDLAPAYGRLLRKGLLRQDGTAWQLTESGAALFQELDKLETFYRYEYDNFFTLSENSAAHALFCERVYGEDLNQHGLADRAELRQLLGFLNIPSGAFGLDLGCGNGRITDFLQQQSGAAFLGVDISPEAIRRAALIPNPQLSFQVGNMNALALGERFDFIVSIDTLYYASSLPETLRACLAHLRPSGVFACFFSQWINGDEEKPRLDGRRTGLAEAFCELAQPFKFLDLSESGRLHWRRKRDALLGLRPAFEAEGSLVRLDRINGRFRRPLKPWFTVA